MYSNAYVWSRVLSYLEQHSPAIAIASYFDDAEVIELTESKLVIYSPSPFRKDVIVKRYIDQIREAMRDQFQTEVEVVVLDETELPQYSKNKKNRNFVEFNSQYTFDKFVVGSSNQHAFSAARAVADNPADAYNPLFIYGESGLGKTHLLYAIANQIQREHPDYNIVYIKGDQFTNELIDAVRSGKNFEFRDKYRNADLFLMDDIQFIAGKDATQEEFFHTFNSLYENKRQIVLTSDRVPGDMVRLEDRLRTRFEWGLIVDVQPPDYETRFIITREKALELGIELPQDVVDYISENIREGMSTAEIDHLVYCFTTDHDAIPAPFLYEGFPKSVCVSINDVVCHGIPSTKEFLRSGDIVNVDVSTIYKGYFSDASRMYMIGDVRPEMQRLVQVTKECRDIGIQAAQPWARLGDVGAAIQEHAEKNGYSVVRDLCGHGVGIKFHEEPDVEHFGKRGTGMLIVPGMTFTIEPMINMGTYEVFIDEADGWTVCTDDGLPSAQWESMILITENGNEILTQ